MPIVPRSSPPCRSTHLWGWTSPCSRMTGSCQKAHRSEGRSWLHHLQQHISSSPKDEGDKARCPASSTREGKASSPLPPTKAPRLEWCTPKNGKPVGQQTHLIPWLPVGFQKQKETEPDFTPAPLRQVFRRSLC